MADNKIIIQYKVHPFGLKVIGVLSDAVKWVHILTGYKVPYSVFKAIVKPIVRLSIQTKRYD